jgi:beta-lactamase regulating signal transducer with metallopeptidase domain
MIDLLFEVAWKSFLCAGLALLVLRLIRSRSAAEKSFVAQLGLLSVLLLPVAALALPDLAVAPPPAVAEAYASLAPAAEAGRPSADAATAPAAAQPSAPAWDASALLLAGYALPAAILLLLTLVGVARLRRLRARADVLVDPRWLTALASAQRRLGLKHGTALLTSNEIASPVSWGILRPIILLDPEAARRVDRAEAIIAHELAHVARLDWLALLLGRLATALFWFNPLVRILARAAHEYSEQAADDFVLRSDVPRADYAEVLVGTARHAAGPALAANGVAPSQSSLARRVLCILDPERSRMPVRLGWSAACLAGALTVGSALAAVDPKFAPQVEATEEHAGAIAAARLAAIPSPQTRAIARAIERQDWNARRVEGDTRFHEPDAVAPLLMALRDPSPTTRRIAAWALSEMRPPEAEAPLARRPGDESLDESEVRAAAALARRLSDESPEVRVEAARALGELGATSRGAEIVRLLRDPEPRVRLNAAHALGDLQDPATRPALEAALADPDPGVRAKAGWALREVAEAEAVLGRYGGG